MATSEAAPRRTLPQVPGSVEQVPRLARYQLREYLRSRRFVALVAIVAAIGAVVTAIVAHFRGGLVATDLAFYGTFWGGGGANGVIVLAAVFFGGDAIAGEFQNKTGYFLMGLPLRRTTVYAGKFVAAFLAATAVLLLYFAILLGNGLYYFGTGFLPWQFALSLLLAIVYLGTVLGATFLFSSLFKTSAYGFVLTAVLFLFGFDLIQAFIVALVKVEPWMILSYARGTIGDVFASPINWGFAGTTSHPFGDGGPVSYTAGVAEGIVIMVGYLLLTAFGGLALFEREEFT